MSNDKKVPLVECFGPTIQGEGSVIGQQTYFLRFGLCIAADQRVLMANWTHKPISQIKEGDYVLAADLGNRGNLYDVLESKTFKTTCLRASKVLRVTNNGLRPMIRIGTAHGSLDCTKEHEVFSYTKTSTNGYWKAAESLSGKFVRQVPLQSWSDEYSLGWLHGAFAGDGNVHKFQDMYWRMKISCSDIEVCDKALEVLITMGAPNPHRIQHNPGNGKPILSGVEVTNHKWVESFRESWLKGSNSLEYMRGWLGGFYDTDGSWNSSGRKAEENSGHITYWQNSIVNEWKLSRCLKYLKGCGFSYSIHERKAAVGMNSVGNVMVDVNKTAAFFTTCPGVLRWKQPSTLNIKWLDKILVNDILPIAQPQEAWDITTEHGNFIAEGMLVHNCDYKCTMCDSMHAVDPASVKALATWLTPEEIFFRLDDYRYSQSPTSTKWVTFSGGNPCIHDLSQLVDLLKKDGWRIAVETQGTFHPEWLNSCDVITVSPKGPGMGEKCNLQELDAFLEHVRHIEDVNIKVVVFDQRDLEFASMLFERYHVVNPWLHESQFYLSLGNPHPPGKEPRSWVGHPPYAHVEELIQRYELMLPDIMRDPRLSQMKFLPQWHVIVWGNKQGV